MPLSMRTVEPSDVSLHRIPPSAKVRDELQCVANGTLTNLIRQLSTLSSHSTHLFNDLNESLKAVDRRVEKLVVRTSRLHDKMQSGANALHQNGRLEDNHMRKPYQTANNIDQHFLSRQTLPAAMMELYNQCDPPPHLNEFNPFRDDPKDALKYYTDPGYFFNLWKEQILRECENDKRMRSARANAAAAHLPAAKSPTRRRRTQRDDSRPIHSNVMLNHYHQSGRGRNDLMQFPTEYQAPQMMRMMQRQEPLHIPVGMSRPQIIPPSSQSSIAPVMYDDEPLPAPPLSNAAAAAPIAYRAPSIAPSVGSVDHLSQAFSGAQIRRDASPTPPNYPPAYPPQWSNSSVAPPAAAAQPPPAPSSQSSIPHIDEDDELPPPPPPLPNPLSHANFSFGIQYLPPAESNAPLPPPPAPMPTSSSSAGQSNALISASLTESVVQSSSFQIGSAPNTQRTVDADADGDSPLPPPIDAPLRPTLEEQVQANAKLKKVQRQAEAAQNKTVYDTDNIMAILQRRMEMGYRDDSSDDAAEQTDDGEWDD